MLEFPTASAARHSSKRLPKTPWLERAIPVTSRVESLAQAVPACFSGVS
jgi:hypothetical protein